MKQKTTLIIFIFLLFTIKTHPMSKDTLLLNLLPDNSFLPVESEKVYETDTELYDYINGGAELYLQYGFKKMAKRIYTDNKQNEIKAEIFNLNAPKNAFGVFSYSMDTVNTDIGQGGQYIGSSLIFWQDKYFVSIFAHKENAEIKEKLHETARKISNSIGKTGALPWSYHIIPEKSIVKGSTFYFHHSAWQNKFRYISNDNIFNINSEVKAFITQYNISGNKHYLLLIEYPDNKKAQKAYKKGRKKISPKLKRQRFVQEKENRWTGCDKKGNLLMFVFDAPSKADAEYLLDQTIENSTQLQ